jgi:hypothetical protein
MSSRLARALAVGVSALLLVGASSAFAYSNTVDSALHDCGSGHDPLKGHYSLKVLQKALKDVKAEPLQYTNCSTILQQAINADSLGKRKTSGPRPVKGKVTRPHAPVYVHQSASVAKHRIQQLEHGAGAPVKLPGGALVTPGAVTGGGASFLSSLPTPLLAVLAALLAVVLAVSGRAIQNVVRARRSR